jgi:diaminopimelate decarboxylase
MQPKELLALAEEFGNPLYVYDAATIEQQYHVVRVHHILLISLSLDIRVCS